MRVRLVALVVLLIVAAMTPTAAKCKRYAAYVYEGTIRACRVATSTDVQEDSKWVDVAASRADLQRNPLSIVTAQVNRIVQVARCNWERGCEPAVTPWDDVTPTDFRFQLADECAGQVLEVGDSVRFYAVRPCCDVEPSESGQCGLRLPIILDPPDWAADIVNEK